MAKFCVHCGTALADNAKFCTNCGHTLNEAAPGAQTAGAAAVPPSAAPQAASYAPPQNPSYAPPPGRACPRCGAALDYDAAFCDVCGVSLSGAPQQAQPAPAKKRKTGLIVVLTILLLAALGVGVYFLFLKDREPSTQPTTHTDASNVSGTADTTAPTGTAEETMPTASVPSGNAASAAGIRLPDGAQIVADATLNDAAGLFKGEFLFTEI